MTERLLRRDEAAQHLQSYGLRTTKASLATMATRGGGPPFIKIGRYSMYRLIELNMWVAQRSTGLLDSTSTLHGRSVDDLFEPHTEAEDIDLDTGQPGFDEITKMLLEEARLQEFLDTDRSKYDQQFN